MPPRIANAYASIGDRVSRPDEASAVRNHPVGRLVKPCAARLLHFATVLRMTRRPPGRWEHSWPQARLRPETDRTDHHLPRSATDRINLSLPKIFSAERPPSIGSSRTEGVSRGPSWPQRIGTCQTWTLRATTRLFAYSYVVFIRSTPGCSQSSRGSPLHQGAHQMTTEPTLHPSARDRRHRHAKTPDPARRDRGDCPVAVGRVRADGRVPLPEADPWSAAGRFGGSSKRCSTSSPAVPELLRSAGRVAGMIRESTRRAARRNRRCRRATECLRSGLAQGPLGTMS